MAAERYQVKGQKDQYGKIEIVGYTKFMKGIKQAESQGYADDLLQKANEQVAQIVIRRANQIAGTKMEKSAAKTLEKSSSRLRVAVTGGGKAAPYFGGANFGANRNTRRLIKAPNQRGRRSRATTVRHGEDVDVVARRVESQSVESSGKTISKRLGGQQVELARTQSGGLRVIRGWNQFKQQTRGRDFFLYRAVGYEEQHITGLYQTVLDRLTDQAFPE